MIHFEEIRKVARNAGASRRVADAVATQLMGAVKTRTLNIPDVSVFQDNGNPRPVPHPPVGDGGGGVCDPNAPAGKIATVIPFALSIASGAKTASDSTSLGDLLAQANSTLISSDNLIPNNFESTYLDLCVHVNPDDTPAHTLANFYIREKINQTFRGRVSLLATNPLVSVGTINGGTAAGEMAATLLQFKGGVTGIPWRRSFDPDVKHYYTVHCAKDQTLNAALLVSGLLHGYEDG